MDLLSASDPFCQVQFKDVKMQTDFVQDNMAPKWNSRFHFVVGTNDRQSTQFDDLDQYLTLSVSDNNKLFKNEIIGGYRVKLRDLLLSKNVSIM